MKLLRRTLPILLSGMRRRLVGLLAVLLVFNLSMSVVPIIKSELESRIINATNRLLTGPNRPNEADSILSTKFESSDSPLANDQSNGIPERTTVAVLDRFPRLSQGFLLYLVVVVLGFVLVLLSTAVRATATREIFARLRAEGFRKGLLAEPREHKELSNVPGQFANSIYQGTSNVSDMYGYLLEVGQYALTLAATMWVLGNKNPTFAWFCGGLIVVQVVVSLGQGRLLRGSRNRWEKSRDDLVGRTGDLLSMRDVILAYEQQHHYENRLKSFSDQYADVERRLTISEQVFKGLSLLVTDLGRIGILAAALVASLATSQSSIATVGDVYFLTSIYVRLFIPVSNLLNRYDDFRRVQSTANSFVDLLEQEDDLHPAHQEDTGPRRTIALTGNAEDGPAIQFDQVAFRYDRNKEHWILRNCTFKVPAGRTTLVVGRSGAGKTTIARIILGYALGNSPLERGEVVIKGRPLDRWSPTDLLGLMSYIAQGNQVVDETVRDNLFPKQDDTEQKMLGKLAAVRISGGHPDPKLLQQRARDLSGGEQQRLVFARMLLDDAEIVIMDEPLTGVDVFTFSDLLPELRKLFQDNRRTVVMFSHRLAFAAFAHHIVVLGDNGTITEQGDLGTLLASNGKFAKLWASARAELAVQPTLQPQQRSR